MSNPGSESISYSWTASSDNPTDITLSNSKTYEASFDISFDLDEGDYIFTLTVSDGTSTVTDSITVSIYYMDKLIASDGAASDNFGRSVSHFQDKGGISVHP
ncbi:MULTISPECIES: hypothetical protein [unclassified Oceanispirochaeta]|uniref:PKD domain-containing protein n=1 Tax=unclassified Oceanispirochaeta TaxID=2635722 RepID=UPI000E08FCF3|nr:hypothetical protein [Oceanispirochaeta sp. M1]MBF9018803.1 hypothetical protein [Oceanispirochaeta sp. M2]NPD75272.1 hypothetical protein [Oceanispirochaeta sp. M1]RDG28862.1 hypothetical protein DV872_24570 [Oceanispirochaeta sp. M1]